ncbi:MAG: ABC transporter permease [Sedimentisphaerales bacterium]|nr:ABC transporter permease [Sedimentisphaerales bacterium]
MNILKQNLKYYWRVNLAAAGASAVCIAVITGALVIGATVRHSLSELARQRLGFVQAVVSSPTGSFDAATATAIRQMLISGGAEAESLKITVVNSRPATAINPAGMQQVGNIELLGITDSLAAAADNEALAKLGINQAAINQELARRLDLTIGDDLILQFSGDNMVAELALYAGDNMNKSWRLTVAAIISADEFGAFALHTGQRSVCNAFVNANELNQRLNQQNRPTAGNLLLMNRPEALVPDQFDRLIINSLSSDDLGIKFSSGLEYSSIRTAGIFFDQATAATISEEFALLPFTGYLVNCVENTTRGKASYYCFAGTGFGDKLDENSVVISSSLAKTIDAAVGDKLSLAYFLPADNGQLIERTVILSVSEIVPVEQLEYMQGLMPEIPGMTDSESCSDWDSGVPVDLDRITQEDEEYWDRYKTTPKMVISYKLAEKLFAGRYGLATALYQTGEFTAARQKQLTTRLKELLPLPVRHVDLEAEYSVSNSLDFGGLFLALSMFLIASALLLPAMLLGLNVQNRRSELALLKALGWPTSKIKWLILTEISVVSKVGVIPGVALGLLYAGLLNSGLNSVFSGATGGLPMTVYADIPTIIIGVLLSVTLVILTAWLKCRKILNQMVRSSLSSVTTANSGKPAFNRRVIIVPLLVLALALLMPRLSGGSIMGYFAGGSCLLISGLLMIREILRLCSLPGRRFSPSQMLWNGLGRGNAGTTLAVVVSLACGMFMVAAVGLNHHNPLADLEKNSGPAGGFGYLAQCSVPLTSEIDSENNFLAFRQRRGDDASCLNLSRAVTPTIIAADSEKLQQLNCFSFVSTAAGMPADWSILADTDPQDNIIPAVTDHNTIVWALHKKVGDLLEIQDQLGREYKLRLCGGLQSSILQGKLLIDQESYKQIFPQENGYRLILFNADKKLEEQLSEYGPEIRPAGEILAELYGVENTYMSLFALLGGMGMIMGNFLLALTVLQSCQSCRRDHAILRALGYSRQQLLRQITRSYALAAITGLGLGIMAALYAIWPKIISNYASLPVKMVAALTVAIALVALLSIITASKLSLNKKLKIKNL